MTNNFDNLVHNVLHEVSFRNLAATGLAAGALFAGSPGQSVEPNASPQAQAVDREQLSDFVAKWEGFRSGVYKDSRGIKSIGYGFNLERPGASEKLAQHGLDLRQVLAGRSTVSRDIAHALMMDDINDATGRARRFVSNYDQLPHDVKLIVTDMAYNLGNKIFQFEKMKDALEANDFKRAGAEAKDSLWYNQVGRRSKHHVSKLASM